MRSENIANILQEFFNKQLEEELSAHPELQGLEEAGKDGSVAPSGSGGTPQPSGTRIKLISSSNREQNGGSTAAQSDED